eukprot:jgi/Bigna1/62193/fgenesh1_kg.31_\
MASGYRLGSNGSSQTVRVGGGSNPCLKVTTAFWTVLDLAKMFVETLINPEAKASYVNQRSSSGRSSRGRPTGMRLGGLGGANRRPMNAAPPAGMMMSGAGGG